MLESARDSVIKKVLEEHPIIKRLGTLHTFSLNTNERTCSLEIGLVGEPYPIRFSANYEILKTESGIDFRLSEIHSEKLWIEELLKVFIGENGGFLSFPVQGIAAKLLQMFL